MSSRSQSDRFLGQDDFFDAEISAIKETRRFITSQEVQLLLTTFLSMVDHVNNPALAQEGSRERLHSEG